MTDAREKREINVVDSTSDTGSHQNRLLAHAAQIVSAYVGYNTVDAKELPQLIEMVFGALSKLHGNGAMLELDRKPAVAIKNSITPDFIICLEDGKKLKMLKRHLRTRYNLTPEEYRNRWNLPADYPMVAPNYAKHRQKLARQIGLGRR